MSINGQPPITAFEANALMRQAASLARADAIRECVAVVERKPWMQRGRVVDGEKQSDWIDRDATLAALRALLPEADA